jgi:hypothetical protein
MIDIRSGRVLAHMRRFDERQTLDHVAERSNRLAAHGPADASAASRS